MSIFATAAVVLETPGLTNLEIAPKIANEQTIQRPSVWRFQEFQLLIAIRDSSTQVYRYSNLELDEELNELYESLN